MQGEGVWSSGSLVPFAAFVLSRHLLSPFVLKSLKNYMAGALVAEVPWTGQEQGPNPGDKEVHTERCPVKCICKNADCEQNQLLFQRSRKSTQLVEEVLGSGLSFLFPELPLHHLPLRRHLCDPETTAPSDLCLVAWEHTGWIAFPPCPLIPHRTRES